MKTIDKIQTDRPQALQTVTDADKAAAITAACKAVTGEAPVARIEMIDYTGRFGYRGPFKAFAELRFKLLPREEGPAAEQMAEAMRRVDDARLADAVAQRLAKLAGEDYVGYIAMKRTGDGRKARGLIADVQLQLAVP